MSIPAPSEYEAMLMDQDLKGKIIAQAGAVAAKEHSFHRTWAIVTDSSKDFTKWGARVIVYKDSSGLNGFDTVRSIAGESTELGALKGLLKLLQSDLQEKLGHGGDGEVEMTGQSQ